MEALAIAADFVTANRLYREQIRRETELLLNGVSEATAADIERRGRADTDRACQARNIYTAHRDWAEAAVAEIRREATKRALIELRAAGLTEWADALESGDYGMLAF